MYINPIENKLNTWFEDLPENVQKIILDNPNLLRGPQEHYTQQFVVRLLKEIEELKSKNNA